MEHFRKKGSLIQGQEREKKEEDEHRGTENTEDRREKGYMG
jgi:hypothetical protein